MELITPGIGLIFWTTLVFIALVVILKKLVWSKIISQINERQERIKQALLKADQVKVSVDQLNERQRQLEIEMEVERKAIYSEAKESAADILEAARLKAKEEADRIIDQAHQKISLERESLRREIKDYLLDLSLLMTQKILRKQLDSDLSHKELLDSVLREVKESDGK